MSKLSPIGITPKWIWESEMKKQRLTDLLNAITRYMNDNVEVPEEWVKEYFNLSIEMTINKMTNEGF